MKKIEVTCILDSLNSYIWMTFIWYPCNLPSIIEKSITSVYFILETWYLDLCITNATCKTLYTFNIKVISEVKGLLFRIPHNHSLLFVCTLITGSQQSSCIYVIFLCRFELYNFFVEAFQCRKHHSGRNLASTSTLLALNYIFQLMFISN